MSAAELISELQKITPDELRAELAVKAQARDEILAQYDQEMELIERLIGVVERPQRKLPATDEPPLPQLAVEQTSTDPGPLPPPRSALPRESTDAGTSSPQTEKPQAAPEQPTAAPPASAPSVRRAPRRTKPERTATSLSVKISTYLDVMGRCACGAIARQLGLDRDVIEDVLETDPQFKQDGQGYWDLKSKVEARESARF